MFEMKLSIEDGVIIIRQADLRDNDYDLVELHVKLDQVPYLANTLMDYFLGQKGEVTIDG